MSPPSGKIRLKSMCRLCLSNAKTCTLIDIFAGSERESFRLASLVFRCTGHQVRCDDNLPPKICKTCLSRAEEASYFRRQSEMSLNFLRQLKERKDVYSSRTRDGKSLPAGKQPTKIKKDKKRYKCFECTKSYTHKRHLWEHVRLRHLHVRNRLTLKQTANEAQEKTSEPL